MAKVTTSDAIPPMVARFFDRELLRRAQPRVMGSFSNRATGTGPPRRTHEQWRRWVTDALVNSDIAAMYAGVTDEYWPAVAELGLEGLVKVEKSLQSPGQFRVTLSPKGMLVAVAARKNV